MCLTKNLSVITLLEVPNFNESIQYNNIVTAVMYDGDAQSYK